MKHVKWDCVCFSESMYVYGVSVGVCVARLGVCT